MRFTIAYTTYTSYRRLFHFARFNWFCRGCGACIFNTILKWSFRRAWLISCTYEYIHTHTTWRCKACGMFVSSNGILKHTCGFFETLCTVTRREYLNRMRFLERKRKSSFLRQTSLRKIEYACWNKTKICIIENNMIIRDNNINVNDQSISLCLKKMTYFCINSFLWFILVAFQSRKFRFPTSHYQTVHVEITWHSHNLFELLKLYIFSSSRFYRVLKLICRERWKRIFLILFLGKLGKWNFEETAAFILPRRIKSFFS